MSFANFWKVLLIALLFLAGCSSKYHKKASSDIDAETLPVANSEGVLRDIHFAYDSYSLSPKGEALLAENATYLKSNKGSSIVIEGHCDERGTSEYNMVLGARRAEVSMRYLRSLGIDSSRMSTISYGEELPLHSGNNELAWAKNRRVHLKIK